MPQNYLISCLQALGIILVVVGHSFDKGTPVHTWIYSFHMPLFMFISGYLLQYGIEKKHIPLSQTPIFGSNGFVYKKAKRLLVPYVVISSIAFLPKAMMAHVAMRSIDFSWRGYIEMFLYPGRNAIIFYWFLPTLFIIFILMVSAARCSRIIGTNVPAIVVIPALLVLNLWSPVATVDFLYLHGVASYLLYFVLGCYSCRYRIVDCFQSSWLLILTSHLSVAMLLLPPFHGRQLLTSLNGIVMSITFAQLYVRRDWHFLHHLYGDSYAIYLFSWFPQVVSRQLFLSVTHAHWMVGSCLSILTGIYIPLVLYKCILRIRYTRVGKTVCFLTGQ